MVTIQQNVISSDGHPLLIGHVADFDEAEKFLRLYYDSVRKQGLRNWCGGLFALPDSFDDLIVEFDENASIKEYGLPPGSMKDFPEKQYGLWRVKVVEIETAEELMAKIR